MNHMLTDEPGHYRMPKHWRDSEDVPTNSKKIKMPKAKNELKSPLYIFIKHMIESMTASSASRIERYVENYCKIESVNTIDKAVMRSLFQNKLRSINV